MIVYYIILATHAQARPHAHTTHKPQKHTRASTTSTRVQAQAAQNKHTNTQKHTHKHTDTVKTELFLINERINLVWTARWSVLYVGGHTHTTAQNIQTNTKTNVQRKKRHEYLLNKCI